MGTLPRKGLPLTRREMRAEGHIPGSGNWRPSSRLPIQSGGLCSVSSAVTMEGGSQGGHRGFGLGESVQVSGGSGSRLDFEGKTVEEAAIAERAEPGKKRRRWEQGECPESSASHRVAPWLVGQQQHHLGTR